MPAPFTVHFGYGSSTGKFDSIVEAIEFAKTCPDFGRILGDGVDYDCDQDGYYMCSDGLSAEERETIEEAGL